MLNSDIPPCCHIALSCIINFDTKVIHRRIPNIMLTCMMLSSLSYCNVDFYCFIMSHVAHFVYYHGSMLTLHASLVSCALWLHDIREVRVYLDYKSHVSHNFIHDDYLIIFQAIANLFT